MCTEEQLHASLTNSLPYVRHCSSHPFWAKQSLVDEVVCCKRRRITFIRPTQAYQAHPGVSGLRWVMNGKRSDKNIRGVPEAGQLVQGTSEEVFSVAFHQLCRTSIEPKSLRQNGPKGAQNQSNGETFDAFSNFEPAA